MPNLVTSSTNHLAVGRLKASVVPRRSGVDIRAFHLLQVSDFCFHLRQLLLKGDKVGIESGSILALGCVH